MTYLPNPVTRPLTRLGSPSSLSSEDRKRLSRALTYSLSQVKQRLHSVSSSPSLRDYSALSDLHELLLQFDQKLATFHQLALQRQEAQENDDRIRAGLEG